MKLFCKKTILKYTASFLLGVSLVLGSISPIFAREHSVYGIHLLHLSELDAATTLLRPVESDTWSYVTIPLTLEDLKKESEWQDFFRKAREKKVIPIVRLMTKFENGAWAVPDKKEIIDMFTFLGKLEWPYEKKYVIVFNEVNHAKEWGGRIDPESYTDVLTFAADWAHTENKNYKVLPAAMDLAAPNGSETREAFDYLAAMHAYNPEVFHKVDYWNSHSYPNPGFSSSPERTQKNSMRGFIHELAFVKEKTGRDMQTFITETGWSENGANRRHLSAYYQYTADHIWSDERVIAATPFILQGDPGPFSGFSFIDRHGKPTEQYSAYQNVIRRSFEKILAEKR